MGIDCAFPMLNLKSQPLTTEMKKSSFRRAFVAASTLALATSAANAAIILRYDSVAAGSSFGAFTYGSATELSEIQQLTDSAFVTTAADTSVVGNKGIMAAIHASQALVAGANSNQNDMQYRFGSDGTTAGNGILNGPLTAAHAASGPRLDFSYTAATTQNLTEFSFHLFNNSGGGSSYGARDVGLFVSVGGGAYTQFGDLFTSPTGNGNQGTVTFSDSFAVGTGEFVDFRLAFTDRTRTNNDLQAATRIGDVQISAVAVPEPSAALLGALGSLMLLRRRRA